MILSSGPELLVGERLLDLGRRQVVDCEGLPWTVVTGPGAPPDRA